MATLDDFDRWNVLRLELENGSTEDNVVVGTGVVDNGHYKDVDVYLDPTDPHTPDDVGLLREYPDRDELEFLPDARDDSLEITVEDVTVVAEDGR